MRFISFAWTVAPLLAGYKTMTRRFWKDTHAARFHAGDLVAAYDKDPRAGGHKVAVIRLTRDPYKQPLSEMTEIDLVREGGLWRSLEEFRSLMPADEPWVLEFELVPMPGGKAESSEREAE